MSVQEPVQLQCPNCGEPIDIWIDISGGSQSYIEDCQVCCSPIQLAINIGADGLINVDALNCDE